MALYRRELDRAGKLFPSELPMIREVFVASSREEAICLAPLSLEAKYKAYRDWGQDKMMPAADHFDRDFTSLMADRFLLGTPAEIAEQILALRHRFGVNYFCVGGIAGYSGQPGIGTDRDAGAGGLPDRQGGISTRVLPVRRQRCARSVLLRQQFDPVADGEAAAFDHFRVHAEIAVAEMLAKLLPGLASRSPVSGFTSVAAHRGMRFSTRSTAPPS